MKKISVLIDDKDWEKLSELKEKESLNPSALIRKAINNFINTRKVVSLCIEDQKNYKESTEIDNV